MIEEYVWLGRITVYQDTDKLINGTVTFDNELIAIDSKETQVILDSNTLFKALSTLCKRGLAM